jgi:hypothetical protein
MLDYPKKYQKVSVSGNLEVCVCEYGWSLPKWGILQCTPLILDYLKYVIEGLSKASLEVYICEYDRSLPQWSIIKY